MPNSIPSIPVHVIELEVKNESDVLKRISILNTAFFRIASATRLIRVLHADYEAGIMRFLVEAQDVHPDIAPGEVTVSIGYPTEEDLDGYEERC